jgi:hypothetical protein
MLEAIVFLIVAAVIVAMFFRPLAMVVLAKAAVLARAYTRRKRKEVEEPKYGERWTLVANFEQAASELRQQHAQWALQERQREQQRQQERADRDGAAHKEWERGYDDGLAGRPFHLREGRMGPAILDYSRGYDEGERVRQRRA